MNLVLVGLVRNVEFILNMENRNRSRSKKTCHDVALVSTFLLSKLKNRPVLDIESDELNE